VRVDRGSRLGERQSALKEEKEKDWKLKRDHLERAMRRGRFLGGGRGRRRKPVWEKKKKRISTRRELERVVRHLADGTEERKLRVAWGKKKGSGRRIQEFKIEPGRGGKGFRSPTEDFLLTDRHP